MEQIICEHHKALLSCRWQSWLAGAGTQQHGYIKGMIKSYTFWLSILAVLITFIGVKLWLRHRATKRAEEARLRAIEEQFPPRSFDTSGITPQIKRVREDYVASARQRWRLAHYWSGLVAAAHRMVATLTYFRRADHEDDSPRHNI